MNKNNVIYRVMILTIIGGLMLLIAYYGIQTMQIRNRSITSLKKFTASTEAEVPGDEPGVDYFTEEDISDGVILNIEQLIWNYYKDNTAEIIPEEVYVISQDHQKAYFLVKSMGEEALIIYTDVSFTTSIVRSSVSVMFLVLAALSILLYFLNRYLVETLNEKDRGMRSFFENASHELKTPLMSIGGYVEGIKTGVTDPEESYRIIDREINRMSKLITDILDISKIDGGIVSPRKSENDLREIIYDCLTALEAAAAEKNIMLSVQLERPIFKNCDEQMMESAFSNILVNALRYAKQEIVVRMNENQIIITNDGEIPEEEEIVHIFERFYKGKNGQNGIGMALTKEYLELNEMTISAQIVQNQMQFSINLTNSK